jgi:hypothetical protein
MQALELVRDAATREPAAAETAGHRRRSRSRGLLLFPAGTYGNVIRFLMPLVMTTAQVDEGLDVPRGVDRFAGGSGVMSSSSPTTTLVRGLGLHGGHRDRHRRPSSARASTSRRA